MRAMQYGDIYSKTLCKTLDAQNDSLKYTKEQNCEFLTKS